MGLFDKLFNKEALPQIEDDQIVSICKGKLIPNSEISDQMFADCLMGKTIGFEPESGDIMSPVNGKITMIFPTLHAFGVAGNDGAEYLVHIGIDTVNLKGKGFKALKKTGDSVKAGETVIKADLNEIGKSCRTTTMLVVTTQVENKSYSFIEPTDVSAYQIINN